MKNVKVATVTALVAALVMGAACGTAQSGDTDSGHEVLIDCYDPKTGQLVKRDDDCRDDGLTAVKPVVSPVRTSAGMQTAGPAKQSPRPVRTRR